MVQNSHQARLLYQKVASAPRTQTRTVLSVEENVQLNLSFKDTGRCTLYHAIDHGKLAVVKVPSAGNDIRNEQWVWTQSSPMEKSSNSLLLVPFESSISSMVSRLANQQSGDYGAVTKLGEELHEYSDGYFPPDVALVGDQKADFPLLAVAMLEILGKWRPGIDPSLQIPQIREMVGTITSLSLRGLLAELVGDNLAS